MSRTRNRTVEPRGAQEEVRRRTFFKTMIGAGFLATTLPRFFAAEVVRIPIKGRGAGPFFQIHRAGKWGYIDRNGKIVISAQFDDERDFFSGFAAVRQGQKWGYISEAGSTVIRYQFDDAGDFKEGLAPVRTGSKWGFIDRAGKFVINPQFQAAAEFSDGLARFEVWDTVECDPLVPGKSRLIYTKEDAPPYAYRLHSAAAVSASGCFPPGARYGFVGTNGNVVIEPRLSAASDFSEGLAVARAEESPAKYGYIDRTGKMVIEPRFDEAYSFSEGLAPVEIGFSSGGIRKVAGRWGFIDQRGRFEIPAIFDDAHSFSEGLAEVRLQDGDWGYIDKHGALAIPPRYSEANPFSEGLALVWPEDEVRGYYIDKSGKKALDIKLWPQWSFSDGLTIAGQEGERKYVNRKGQIVAPYEVDPRY